jgi:hypothetical protein
LALLSWQGSRPGERRDEPRGFLEGLRLNDDLDLFINLQIGTNRRSSQILAENYIAIMPRRPLPESASSKLNDSTSYVVTHGRSTPLVSPRLIPVSNTDESAKAPGLSFNQEQCQSL